ncbi:putative protein K02A2.6-like [Crotalus adamanteus]|uniref:Integrase catalytic domain-containing protein n=1 Tax=Crotalus adamanteus TaxID=8729 RepID=A0AAW1BD57_CROAD
MKALVCSHLWWLGLDKAIEAQVHGCQDHPGVERNLRYPCLPDVLISDNGPQFTSFEFQAFLQANLIWHETSAPFHPSNNGQAERMVAVDAPVEEQGHPHDSAIAPNRESSRGVACTSTRAPNRNSPERGFAIEAAPDSGTSATYTRDWNYWGTAATQVTSKTGHMLKGLSSQERSMVEGETSTPPLASGIFSPPREPG